MKALPVLRFQLRQTPGLDVQRMQALLLVAGRKVKLDGQFGTETLAALNGFQRQYKLEPTGQCDQKTWQKLLG